MSSPFFLLCLYCLFTLIVGFQIARILYYRYEKLDFLICIVLLTLTEKNEFKKILFRLIIINIFFIYSRHALISFQLGFLVLCFVWGILRLIFWSFIPLGASSSSLGQLLLLWYVVMLSFRLCVISHSFIHKLHTLIPTLGFPLTYNLLLLLCLLFFMHIWCIRVHGKELQRSGLQLPSP